MSQTPKGTPKDVFSYLLAIAMLYVAVISFLTLLFQYINFWLPDQLDFYFSGSTSTVLRSTASLIVVWPVYILMTWLLDKDAKIHVEKREIKVRKWLLYLTLFISAVTIIIDLITLIYNFLGGELSLRFGLKVLVVLLVAAGVFGYYLWDIRRDGKKSSQIPKLTAWIASAVVLASIVAGFFIYGSPATQRQIRFDQQRVLNYWQQKDALPEELTELEDSLSGWQVPLDPETNEAYEYQVEGELSFKLCGYFTTQNKTQNISPKERIFLGSFEGNFEHGIGRECFSRTIDPELYKLDKLLPQPVR
jgi:hypothetical protein